MQIPPPLPGQPGGEYYPDDSYPGEGDGGIMPTTPNGTLAPADEFPWLCVGVGAGALVLIGGVAYIATRK